MHALQMIKLTILKIGDQLELAVVCSNTWHLLRSCSRISGDLLDGCGEEGEAFCIMEIFPDILFAGGPLELPRRRLPERRHYAASCSLWTPDIPKFMEEPQIQEKPMEFGRITLAEWLVVLIKNGLGWMIR